MKYNEFTRELNFQINDLLFVISLFLKMFPMYTYIIQMSNWNDPKAQRCCSILGVEANVLFGLKALMKQDPAKIVFISFLFSVTQLSISLQIFEREVDLSFKNLTTTLWVVIITLTSVGYGDYYPKSDCGRLIAIIIAFWGIFFLSLLVVALTNTLQLEESEQRAFVLLRKIFTRQD